MVPKAKNISTKKTKVASARQLSVKKLRVLSYNIHQGLTIFDRKISLALLRQAIVSLKADIVILQEVAGIQSDAGRKFKKSPVRIQEPDFTSFQLENLADSIWPYFAYGKNAIFSGGFHGNAILSKYPICDYKNVDISMKGLLKRGLLHAQIEVPGQRHLVNVVGTHLGLLQYERKKQLRWLCEYIQKELDPTGALIMGGDFNDWREKVSPRLAKELKLKEAFMEQDSKHARTFPSRFPVLRLDRIYYRGAELNRAQRVWGRPWLFLSDHLPLIADFHLEEQA